MIPKAVGGGDEEQQNIVYACHNCNQEKGCLNVDEFRAVVAMREGLLLPEAVRSLWVFYGELDEVKRDELEQEPSLRPLRDRIEQERVQERVEEQQKLAEEQQKLAGQLDRAQIGPIRAADFPD